jgi:hypothetical protein
VTYPIGATPTSRLKRSANAARDMCAAASVATVNRLLGRRVGERQHAADVRVAQRASQPCWASGLVASHSAHRRAPPAGLDGRALDVRPTSTTRPFQPGQSAATSAVAASSRES